MKCKLDTGSIVNVLSDRDEQRITQDGNPAGEIKLKVEHKGEIQAQVPGHGIISDPSTISRHMPEAGLAQGESQTCRSSCGHKC